MSSATGRARPGACGGAWAFVGFATVALGTAFRASRWPGRLAALALLALGGMTPAHAQVMSFTGTSPTYYTGPDQVITFHLTFGQSNAVTTAISLNNMSIPLSGFSCAGLPLAPGGTTTCTGTYTTSASDFFGLLEFGQFTATSNGVPRGGSISNRMVVPYGNTPPTAQVFALMPGVDEDGGALLRFQVGLDKLSNVPVTLNYSLGGTATAGSDYAPVSGSVTLPLGAMNWEVTVDPIADSTYEPDETVVLSVTPGTGYNLGSSSSATGTIRNDDAAPVPDLAIDDVTLAEGNSGARHATFTVSLGNPAGAGGVQFDIGTANDTATAGGDYVATSLTGQTIPAGSSSYSFRVPVNGDALYEADESFFVNVTNVTGATVTDAQGRATITNDDALPALSIGNITLTEGDSGTTSATFTVTLNAASASAVTVDYATADGTADAADYQAASGSLTFAPGQTSRTLSVAVHGDALVETDETFNVVISNATGASIAQASATATIVNDDAAVTVGPATLVEATVGVPYNASISASGGTAPYTYAVTGGALPAGLSLSAGGLISGTATAGGTFNFTITATDDVGNSGSRAYGLSADAATVAIQPAALPAGTAGVAYSQAITASGGTAPYTYAVTSGALPPGLTLSAAGVLSGTPNGDGTFNVTITATDSSTGAGPYAGSRAYSLEIAVEAPSAGAVSASLPFNSPATPITLALAGGAADSVAVASAPANGTAVASGTGISYRPEPGFSGTDTFTYTATNASGTSAPATVSITVGAPTLAINDSGPGDGVAASAYTRTFTFIGGTAPYTALDVSGLPAGLAVSATTTDSVTVSGTPTATGQFTLVVSGTDSSTGDGPFDASQSYALEIAAPALALAPGGAALDTAYLASFSQAFTAAGGNGPYTYAYSGTAVPGLAFAGDTLSGTPSAPGTYRFTITATDTGTTGDAVTVAREYTLTVAAAEIVVGPENLPDGKVGAAFATTLTATGGRAPYTFALAGGALPAGLELADDGALGGTPTAAGSATFTVTATDANGPTGTREYTLVVGEAAPVAVADTATTLSGEAVTIDVAGNDRGVIDTLAIARAPAHGTASVDGLAIVYVPAAGYAGSDTLSYTAGGPGGTSAAVEVAITVNAVPVPLSREVDAMAGIPMQVDLTEGATGGPFTAATLVSLSPASAGSAAIRAGGSGYVLDFTAEPAFSGEAVARFTVANANATSAVATITFNVSARPDPSQDPEVLGAIDAQVESTRRFATAQIGNFQQRLEQLRGDRSSSGFTYALGLQPRQAACDRTPGSKLRGECARNMTGGVDTAVPASDVPAATAARADRLLGVWVGGSIRSGDVDNGPGRVDVDFESDGISVGADYRVNERFVVGGGLGYGRDRNDVGTRGSSVDGDARTLALYGSFHPGERFFANGLVGYQQLSYDLERYLVSTGGFAAGQRDGDQWFASLSAGADIQRDALQVTPYGRLDIARARLEGYAESGDAYFALRHGAMDVDTSTGSLGVHMQYAHRTGWGQLAPTFRLEYQHDFSGRTRSTVQYADLLGGPLYPVEDWAYNRNRWNLGVGLMISAPSDWGLRLEYRDTIDSEGLDDHGLMLNAQKQF
jgi:uncharacterized protein YhjY with autotransporter beta-barrel domain